MSSNPLKIEYCRTRLLGQDLPPLVVLRRRLLTAIFRLTARINDRDPKDGVRERRHGVVGVAINN